MKRKAYLKRRIALTVFFVAAALSALVALSCLVLLVVLLPNNRLLAGVVIASTLAFSLILAFFLSRVLAKRLVLPLAFLRPDHKFT
jgi:hypothetical protein